MNVEIVTKEDLQKVREELLNDFKSIMDDRPKISSLPKPAFSSTKTTLP